MKITNAMLRRVKRGLLREYKETQPITPAVCDVIIDNFIEKLLEKLKK